MGKLPETKQIILDQALSLVRTIGFESISIGGLAKQVGMSKSGIFAHFKSKESLQIMVIDHAANVFVKKVVMPALKKKRGLARLEAIISNWAKWSLEEEGGSCPLIAAAIEFDDRPGEVKERVREMLTTLHQTLVRSCQISIEEGDFSPKTDCQQVAQEIFGAMMSYHLYKKTINDPQAEKRFKKTISKILESSKP